jgi:hypothetical protein
MTARRAAWATLAVVAALLLATSGPAAAAEGLVVNITSPPADGEPVRDPNAVIAGIATTDVLHVVKSVRVTVTRSNAEAGSCDAPVAPDGSFSCSPGFHLNGPYEAVVTATDALHLDLGDIRTTQATRNFKVEAPPAPPQDVRVEVGPDRRVTVSWARNTEPDLRSYRVSRVGPGGSGESVVSVVPQPPSGERVSTVDGSLPPTGGAYGYVVTAIRPDRDGRVSNRAVAPSSVATVEVGGAPAAGVGAPGPGGPGPGTGPGRSPTAGRTGGESLSSALPGAGGELPVLAVPEGEAPRVDDGFALPGGEGSEAADPAVLVDSGSPANERALFVPIAAGLFLTVLAFHLRQFSRAVLDAPAAYHPLLEVETDDGAGGYGRDDAAKREAASETAVLVGARRPPREG